MSNEAKENRERAQFFQHQRAIQQHLNGGRPSLWQRWRRFSESVITGMIVGGAVRDLFK